MACRSGCPTQDHATYGECLRSSNITTSITATPRRAWDAELHAYAEARRQGIQPAGTQMHQVRDALDLSDTKGAAFDAANPLGV